MLLPLLKCTTHADVVQVVGASETLSELPNDPLQIADSIAMVNTASDESALLLIATCGDGPLLLPPEGVIGRSMIA